MSDKVDTINDNVEIPGSSPKRIRPTDRQMGLGMHDFWKKIIKKERRKNNIHKILAVCVVFFIISLIWMGSVIRILNPKFKTM